MDYLELIRQVLANQQGGGFRMPPVQGFAPPVLPQFNVEPLPHKRDRKRKTYSPFPSGATGEVSVPFASGELGVSGELGLDPDDRGLMLRYQRRF